MITWLLAVLTIEYLLPWAIAATRGTSNSWAVGLLNRPARLDVHRVDRRLGSGQDGRCAGAGRKARERLTAKAFQAGIPRNM